MKANEIADTFARVQREALVRDLRSLRLEARELARSGHPGARAEGKRAVKQITADVDELMRYDSD